MIALFIPYQLLSFKPLMKISMTMKDSLILVLRKAMFSRYVFVTNSFTSSFEVKRPQRRFLMSSMIWYPSYRQPFYFHFTICRWYACPIRHQQPKFQNLLPETSSIYRYIILWISSISNFIILESFPIFIFPRGMILTVFVILDDVYFNVAHKRRITDLLCNINYYYLNYNRYKL